MYLVDRTKTTCRPCAYLPCATEGCPYAVIHPKSKFCCASCKNGKHKHNRTDHQRLPPIGRAQGEWVKLRPCLTNGCDRAVDCTKTSLRCCQCCGPAAGRKHDDAICDALYVVGAPPKRRLAAQVDRLVTSACRSLYENAMHTFRQLEARRRESTLKLHGKSAAAAKRVCKLLYESGLKLAMRRQEAQQAREMQLSTIVQRERARTEMERRERQRLYELQNGWLAA